MNWQSVTALVIVAVIVGLVLYDLVAFALGGNDATLSKTLLDVSRQSAWFALSFVFALGVLVGHLFLPQSKPKDDRPEEPKA
jgi:hypothetical protein